MAKSNISEAGKQALPTVTIAERPSKLPWASGLGTLRSEHLCQLLVHHHGIKKTFQFQVGLNYDSSHYVECELLEGKDSIQFFLLASKELST